jgi:hypothetical protein
MFHRVREVKPLSDYKLCVSFLNGEKRLYDVKLLFDKWTSFNSLRHISSLWEQVKVDSGGYGISWNDELDLACDELYFNGSAENK